jgi:hypothetical protein
MSHSQAARWPAGARVRSRTTTIFLEEGPGTLLWPPLFDDVVTAAWRFAEEGSGGEIREEEPLTLVRSTLARLNREAGRRPSAFAAVSALFLSEARLYEAIGTRLSVKPHRLVFWPDPEKRRNVLNWIEREMISLTGIRQDSESQSIRSPAFRPVSMSIEAEKKTQTRCLLQCLYPMEIRVMPIAPRSQLAAARLRLRKQDQDGEFHWLDKDLEAVYGPDWASQIKTVHLDAGAAYVFHPRTPVDFDGIPSAGHAKIAHLSLITLGPLGISQDLWPQDLVQHLPQHLRWRVCSNNK